MQYPPTVVSDLIRERHHRLIAEATRHRLAAAATHPITAGRLRQAIGHWIVAIGTRIQSGQPMPAGIEEPC